MSIRSVLALGLLSFAACGGGDGDDNPGNPDGPKPVDARLPVDAAPSKVEPVDPCPDVSMIKATFTTDNSFKFIPEQDTIAVGEIVQFTATNSHPIGPIPGDPNSDSGIVVPVGPAGADGVKCFKFPQAGTYRFQCTPHMFKGTLTVNP